MMTPVLPSPEIVEQVANMLHDLMVPQPGASKEEKERAIHPLRLCPKAALYRDLARTVCVVVLEWAAQ